LNCLAEKNLLQTAHPAARPVTGLATNRWQNADGRQVLQDP